MMKVSTLLLKFAGLIYSFYMRKGLGLEPLVLSARPGVFVSQAQALIGFSEATTQVYQFLIY